ncbi:hypothetical protein GCM10010415_30910 [Streptomyces atrovirens]|uniref:Uncharacterized protein n=1 Tax=Streptomyces atrovirens TaxID=285556 RepID=A0ABW0DW22_9ACTN
MTTTPARPRPPHHPGDDVRRFADDPLRWFGGDRDAMHRLPAPDLTALQLAALRLRFTELAGRLPVVGALAREQHLDHIGTLDDAAPLLLPHTVYKSYPASLLSQGRFDQLTRWISQLTTVDLGGLDTAGCDSVDAWLALIDDGTRLRLAHSSGTSGTMSFVPHTAEQYALLYETVRQDTVPPGTAPDEPVHVVWPSHRSGRSGIARHATAMSEQLARHSPDHFHTLDPGHLSADLMLLAARVQAAGKRPGQAEIPPALREQRDRYLAARRSAPQAMRRFTADLAERLRGERIVSLSLWETSYQWARAGLDQGLDDVFAPDSVVMPGGGTKGSVLPQDWAAQVARFAGVPSVRLCYAMVELIMLSLVCPAGAYHVEPWIVPYVLDPGTGGPLPRQGTVRGRAAFFDLTADVYWGGFVTGDHVAVSYDSCPCGRTTPRVEPGISRFEDDDKITCAATADALDDALDYLADAAL